MVFADMLSGADVGSVGFADVSQHDVQGDCISYLPELKRESKRLCMDLNRLTYPNANASFVDGKPNFIGVSQTPYPEVTMSEQNMVSADCSVKHPINTHGMEAKNSKFTTSPMGSISLECDTPSVLPYPNRSQEIVDGRFLSLGMGGAENNSDSKFSSREIASKLMDPMAGQTPTNSLNPTPTVRFQTNVDGLSSSSLAYTRDESALYGGTRPKINRIQISGFHTSEASPPSNRSTTYDSFGPVNQSPMGTEMPRPTTSFANQVIPLQRQCHRRCCVNATSESSRHRGSSVGLDHVQLGRLISLAEAKRPQNIAGVCLPGSVQVVGQTPPSHNVSSIAGVSSIPERFPNPIPKVAHIPSAAAAAAFPRRLGVQPTTRTIGGHNEHAVRGQVPMVSPRYEYSSGQNSPLARCDIVGSHGVMSRPHMKRPRTVNPSDERLLQWRRIAAQRAVMNLAATASRIPPVHLKWEGFDEAPERNGGHNNYKCMLCERDISFASEGQARDTAVLPCGHTFHDDCLQRITPTESLRDPPCIPCALGQT